MPTGMPAGMPQAPMLPGGVPGMPVMAAMPGQLPPQMMGMGIPGAPRPMIPGPQGGVPGVAPPPMAIPPGMDPAQMQAMLQYQQMMQQQAMAAAQATLHAAQAYDQKQAQTIDADVTELAHKFKLDDRITKDLDVQLKKRKATFDEDMKALWEILEGARNPAGLLRVKIREMEEGSFRGTGTPDKDVEDMARKFNLDAQASAKLSEVLSKREDRKKDLRQIAKHLELSNKPSSLMMLMLKDLRNGIAVKDPEFPAAVGSYAHKRGLDNTKKDKKRGRSRSRGRRRRDSDSSSSPPRQSGAGPLPSSGSSQPKPSDGARPRTLLEMFG